MNDQLAAVLQDTPINEVATKGASKMTRNDDQNNGIVSGHGSTGYP